jgi:hypothetical protein
VLRTYVRNVRTQLKQLIDELTQLAYERELDAEHAREFIPDATPLPRELIHALRAAVASGEALGLQRAAERIVELLQE